MLGSHEVPFQHFGVVHGSLWVEIWGGSIPKPTYKDFENV